MGLLLSIFFQAWPRGLRVTLLLPENVGLYPNTGPVRSDPKYGLRLEADPVMYCDNSTELATTSKRHLTVGKDAPFFEGSPIFEGRSSTKRLAPLVPASQKML